MRGAHGDQADFKGKQNGIYAVLSTTQLSLHAQFQHDSFFTPYSKMWISGSWIRSVYWVVQTGARRGIRLAYNASEPHVIRISLAESAAQGSQSFGGAVDFRGQSKRIDDVLVSRSMQRVTVTTPRWRTTAAVNKGRPHPGILRMAVEIQPQVRHSDGSLLDTHVWPHGLLGQSEQG